MKVVLHMGLAKTGTTFLQHLCTVNHGRLAERGTQYLLRSHYTCWPLLMGDPSYVITHMKLARDTGCSQILASCEDYAALIFRPDLAVEFLTMVEKDLEADVTIALHIRRQDELFWSLYSTLSINMFMDPLMMFYDAMRQGYVHIANANDRRDLAPYYYFCFDHGRHIGAFLDGVTERLPQVAIRLYLYGTERDFPGAELLSELGVRDAVKDIPGEGSQNKRRTMAVTAKGFADMFAEVAPAGLAASTRHLVEGRSLIGDSLRDEMSSALMDRFGAGNAPLLRRFGHESALHGAAG